MKYRTSFWLKKADVEFVRNICPIYGAKNLSALINGLLYFFSYAQNPPEVDIRRLLSDALAGKVYVENPAVLRADTVRTDFLEFIAETYEETMLSQVCRDYDFLDKNLLLRLNIQHGLSEAYGHTITDAELDELFTVWRDTVVQSGKYREAYKEYNEARLARARAKQEQEDY